VGAIRLIETAASLPVPIGRRSVGARVPRFAAAGRGCSTCSLATWITGVEILRWRSVRTVARWWIQTSPREAAV